MNPTDEELKEQREEMKRQAKKERNKKQYEKTKDECLVCDVCACRVSKYYMETHLKTTRHQKWKLLKENNILKSKA